MMWDFWRNGTRYRTSAVGPSDNPLLNNLQCSYAPDGPMFTPDYMARMRTYFTQAEKLANSPDILARVKKAKLSLLYLNYLRTLGYYTEFGDFHVRQEHPEIPRGERDISAVPERVNRPVQKE